MMRARKLGQIYAPDGSSLWAQNSALQPTPLLIDSNTIRVYVGMRDIQGVSRVGCVDLDARNPLKVIRVSENPLLDIGTPGTFDENGVVPCAILKKDSRIYLYYAGYQLGNKVRFFVFSGLAVSDDNGYSFSRVSKVPIIDRSDTELYFRVIHSIINENGKWKAWYGAGSTFDQGKEKTLPRYNVRFMESCDGINFPSGGQVVIDMTGDEHRIGRPYVVKKDGKYIMFYGIGTEKVPYRLGYATSKNGMTWERKDDLDLSFSSEGWDSEMMAYPAVLECHGKTYLFYNGNNYGRTGFGCAELELK